jgi:hypothetical protein
VSACHVVRLSVTSLLSFSHLPAPAKQHVRRVRSICSTTTPRPARHHRGSVTSTLVHPTTVFNSNIMRAAAADRYLYSLSPPGYDNAYIFTRKTPEDSFSAGEKFIVRKSILNTPQVYITMAIHLFPILTSYRRKSTSF